MPTVINQKWFTAIPLPHTEEPAWWEREAGLLCQGFRALGVDSKFVLFGPPGPRSDPFLLASRADMESSAWWKQQGMYGVVLYSWGAPRQEPIARAIHESGAKLVVRMDTDGVCSPRVWFWRFASVMHTTFRDARKFFPATQALAKALLFRFYPPVFDHGFKKHLGHADLILVESPLAEQRVRRCFNSIGAPELSRKLMMITPQISPHFSYDESVPKLRQILAVGRWDAAQKDAPMLIAALGRVLAEDSQCRAVIAGGGTEVLHRLIAGLPDNPRARISILGRVPHENLLLHYRQSRILFFSSRFEGFPNSAVEALACGCAVVGPGLLSSMHACTQPACGTVACRRTPQDFADALLAELSCWDRGERHPAVFSAWWQQQAWAPNVARRLLDAFATP